MIKSIAKLNNVLEPDEQYIWHAPLAIGANGSQRKAVGYLVFIGMIGLFALKCGPIGWATGTAALCFVAYMIGEFMIKPYEMLIITNRRAIHLTRKMKVITSFPYDRLDTLREAAGTVTVRAFKGDTTIRWMCAANAKHVEHLTRHLPQKSTDTNLLSS